MIDCTLYLAVDSGAAITDLGDSEHTALPPSAVSFYKESGIIGVLYSVLDMSNYRTEYYCEYITADFQLCLHFSFSSNIAYLH
jgi:hypothetical protein